MRFLTSWGAFIRLANVSVVDVDSYALVGGHIHDHETAIVVVSDHDGAFITTRGGIYRDSNRARSILILNIEITEVHSSIQEVRKNGASLIVREVKRLNCKSAHVWSAICLSQCAEQLLSVVCVDSTYVVDIHLREEVGVVHQVS